MAGIRVFPNALELRAVAARSSMERIDQDLARAGSKLTPLLEHIRAHLFSPGLNVRSLKQACGVRDNSVSTAFGRSIGLPPRPYIEARRLETAERLLRDTALPVHQVGDLVGFSSEAVFYRAFRRLHGEGPRRFRKRAQAGAGNATEGLRPEAVQRALRGRASAHETEAIIQGLTVAREAAPDEPPPVAERQQAQGAAEVPVHDAEAMWDELSRLDTEGQRQRVRRLGRIDSALTELLFVKSRTEGRGNRAYGVHIAQLAVDSLYPGGRALASFDAQALSLLRARAFAWLGNAQRLALEYALAAEALAMAQRLLPDGAPAAVIAEMLEIESSLRFNEGRYGEAVRQIDRALAALAADSEAHGPHVARLWIQHARSIFETGDVEAAEHSLHTALTLLLEHSSPFLELMAYELLAYVYLRAGRFVQAAVLLPAIHGLATNQGLPNQNHLWMTGLVYQGIGQRGKAYEVLQRAREAFVENGDRLNAGIVCIDLALVSLEQAHPSRAVAHCVEALPLLQVNRQHQELLAAIRIVSRAARDHTVSAQALAEVRRRFERLRQDPRVVGS